MRRTAILALTLLASIAVQGQVRHRAVPANPVQPIPAPYFTPSLTGPWFVEVTSTGGFGGTGSGRDVRVDSTGKLTVGQFLPGGRQCTFQLTPDQLLEAFRVVLNARAELWFASYVPANIDSPCCDKVLTTVRMQRQEIDSRGTVWTSTYKTDLFPSENHAFVPVDLVGLYNALEENFGKYNDQCR